MVANLANALYASQSLEPSASFLLLYYFGMAFGVLLWIRADSRRLGVRQVLDQGWFTLCAWPLALPYHLFKTRGPRGGLTLLGLVGLFFVTYAISLLVFYAIASFGRREAGA